MENKEKCQVNLKTIELLEKNIENLREEIIKLKYEQFVGKTYLIIIGLSIRLVNILYIEKSKLIVEKYTNQCYTNQEECDQFDIRGGNLYYYGFPCKELTKDQAKTVAHDLGDFILKYSKSIEELEQFIKNNA